MGKKKGDEESDCIGGIISKPHPHDVLCGRGGLTNQHTGNEWFRRLVRSNRPLYRSCPKHTKLLVAKAIVQAVQQQEPAGRFLEVAQRDEGLWRQISYKRAVDKTSQALREKEPPQKKGGGTASAMPAMDPPLRLPNSKIQNEAAAAAIAAAKLKGKGKGGKKKDADLSDLAEATLKQAGFIAGEGQKKVTPASAVFSDPPVDLGQKRKPPPPTEPDFVKPSWWGRAPGDQSGHNNNNIGDGRPEKRIRTEDAAPPPEPLQTRQSSLFRFLSNTSIFGGVSDQQKGQQQQLQQQQQRPHQPASNSFFGFSSGNNNNSNNNNNNRNPAGMISQQGFQSADNRNTMSFGMGQGVVPPTNQPLQMGSSTFLLDPLPINDQNRQGSTGTQQQQLQNSVGSQPNQMQQVQRQQMQERMIQMQQHMQQQMQMQMEQLRRQQQQQQQSQRSGNDTGNFLSKVNNSNNNNLPRSALRSSLVNNNNDVFGAKNNKYSGMDNLQPNFQSIPAGGGQKTTSVDPGAPPPPNNRLTSQVSDWLTSFFPLGKERAEELPSPEPLADNLERSVSSTLINFARSPSQFLTSLRTGVSSMFGDNNNTSSMFGDNNNNNNSNNNDSNTAAAARTSFEVNGDSSNDSNKPPPVLGTESRGDSLLDDYEESPMETRLRMGISQ